MIYELNAQCRLYTRRQLIVLIFNCFTLCQFFVCKYCYLYRRGRKMKILIELDTSLNLNGNVIVLVETGSML